MSDSTKLVCPCGCGLTSDDWANPDDIAAIIERLGPTVAVPVARHGKWAVPRLYIAFHGLAAPKVPELAAKHGWERLA